MKHRRESSFASVLTSTVRPGLQTLAAEFDGCERTLPDALVKPKAVGPSLIFRRSCRETRGPDAVNINGESGLAC